MAWDLLLKNTVDASVVAFWWKSDSDLLPEIWEGFDDRRQEELDVKMQSDAEAG